ncbi:MULTISPECIES: SPASM domain-containing protein [Clostridia]|uniref:SPASM domain-containing protein n=1 Tax=Clostridia TaxID=186801 RepID=UPI001FAA5487|nr:MULTISPECIES: SPASM domain-containing protein [Clostridia]
MGYQPEACDQRGTCGIQTVVEADGSVYPCDFYMLDEYRLGNFNFNRLDDINAKRIELKFIERSLRLEKNVSSALTIAYVGEGVKEIEIY